MYRHFAAITLALTMGLAMFANGENHEARATQSDQVEVAAQEEPARIVRAPKSATPEASSQWYSEALDSAFGQPMARPLGATNSGFIPDEIEEMPAEEAEQPSGLTQADRDMLLRQLRENHPPLAAASAAS